MTAKLTEIILHSEIERDDNKVQINSFLKEKYFVGSSNFYDNAQYFKTNKTMNHWPKHK